MLRLVAYHKCKKHTQKRAKFHENSSSANNSRLSYVDIDQNIFLDDTKRVALVY